MLGIEYASGTPSQVGRAARLMAEGASGEDNVRRVIGRDRSAGGDVNGESSRIGQGPIARLV